MTIRRTAAAGLVATALAVACIAPSIAAQPSTLRAVAGDTVTLTEAARDALARFHLKDVVLAGATFPEVVIEHGSLRLNAVRAIIDARVINVFLIRRARHAPAPSAATTTQAIDTWTNTVIVGVPQSYGTAVDQWIAMAYFLRPQL